VPVCAGGSLALLHPQNIQQRLRDDALQAIEACRSTHALQLKPPRVDRLRGFCRVATASGCDRLSDEVVADHFIWWAVHRDRSGAVDRDRDTSAQRASPTLARTSKARAQWSAQGPPTTFLTGAGRRFSMGCRLASTSLTFS